MRPQAEDEEGVGHRGPALILLWAPSRLVKELRAACLPELQEQYRLQYHLRLAAAQQAGGASPAAPAAPAELPPLAVRPLGDGLVAEVAPAAGAQLELPRLLAAARQCSLLSAVLRPLASAPTLDEAAAAAVHQLTPPAARLHPLRVLSLGSGAARAPAERFLRRRLQQLGLGVTADASQPRVWCIQWDNTQQAAEDHAPAAQQPRQPQRQGQPPAERPPGSAAVLLGLELAAGAPQPGAAAGRKLGPTAMLPELAAVSASLAGVQPGSVVLDPFCGSGSIVEAAAQRGASLAVGSDIDSSHFAAAGVSSSGSGGTGSTGGAGGGPVFLQADVARLQQLLPAGAVDAVLTDIPYGYRTVAAVQPGSAEREAGASSAAAGAAAAEEEDWQRLVAVLLQLAEHVLAPGGRLLIWLPRQGSADIRGSTAVQPAQQLELAERGRQHHLSLRHALAETRQAGYPRMIAVFERVPAGSSSASDGSSRRSSGGDGNARLLARLQAARLDGVPVFNLPDPQAQRQQPDQPAAAQQLAEAGQRAGAETDVPAAVRQRGVKYKQVRGAAAGTAIDVWRAAWLGDCGAISKYAAAGGDVNARDRKGQAPLQFAAGYGREAAAALLLELGGDPSAAADRSGMAALHRSAARNHAGVLRLLLAAGADCGQRSAAGQTALMYASQFGHAGAVQLLLEHLGAAGSRPACQPEEPCGGSTMQATLSSMPPKGGSPRPCSGGLRDHLALCDASGLTALHLAAQWGMADVAERLLAADPDQPSACEQQLVPAHLAARWGHPAVLETLQRHGADLRRRCGGRGWQPLQEAEEWRRPSCVQLLQRLCSG